MSLPESLNPRHYVQMKKWLVVMALVGMCCAPIGAEQKTTSHPSLITGLSLEVFFPPTDPRHPDYEEVPKYRLPKRPLAFPRIPGAVVRWDWAYLDLGIRSSGTH